MTAEHDVPLSQARVRRSNLSRVLHAVRADGPLSRAAIAGRIGLTRAAVSTLADELLRAGLLVELGPGPASGVGRPGSALALAGTGWCGIGAEVGVDRLAVCVVDLRGDLRVRREKPGRYRGVRPAPVLSALGDLVRDAVREAAVHDLTPAGLALALPGLVRRDTATLVRAPNLGWPVTDVTAHLDCGVPLSPAHIDNEANFGALAELWLGADPELRDFVHVSAQIGIGGAVVLGGRPLRGVRGFAGELGHVPVRPGGPACACGGRGCLETYAGEEAVLRAAGLPASAGAGELEKRAADGDRAARRALRRAGTALGVALAGTVNLLDPGAVVLGGTLARLGPWLLPALRRELSARTAAPGEPPPVRISALGTDGPVLGAAHAVVRATLEDPPT